jgi:hypothetical protein
MIECYRCEPIMQYLKRTLDKRAPALGYERIKGNLEEIYKQSNCAGHELVCNPLKKLESENPNEGTR